jgi:uncharacterized membrane protein
MTSEEFVAGVARALDIVGVLAIVAGAITAIVVAARAIRRGGDGTATYRAFRHDLGRAIILGLELLVAADIVHTIAERPTLAELATLAAIIAIRTALSFTLAVELEGRWPWQAARARS